MIEVLVGLASLVIGFAGGSVVRRRLRPEPTSETMFSLRHAGQVADAYRASNAEVACTLDELRAALDKAGFPTELRRGDLLVQRGSEQLRIVIADPRRVTLTSIDINTTSCELLGFEVALALVPTFGPMRMTDSLWGRFEIDGSHAAAALVEQRGERIKEMARAIAEDTERKQAVWSQVRLP